MSKQELITIKGKLFRWLIITTILMLMLEVLGWVFDGQPGTLNFFFNSISNFFFIAFNVVVVSLWTSYIDYIIYEDEERLKRRWYYFQPTIIIFILAVINLFYPILYVINDENVYSRLPLIWISMIFTGLYYMYALYLVLKNKKYLNSNVLYGVLTFLLLPLYREG